MREVFEGAIVVLLVTFMTTLGFQVLAWIFGIIDFAQAILGQYIPPDPTFGRWYIMLRNNIPRMATISLFVSIIAAFIYLVIAAQKRRYYEWGVLV